MADQNPSLKDHPKILPNLKDHLHNFNTKDLKNVESRNRIILPTADVIAKEKAEMNLRQGIHGFNTTQMKKVETREKNSLPTKEVIEQERKH